MENLANLIDNLNGYIYTYFLCAVLVILGVYFSAKTLFVQVRMLREMLHLILHGAVNQGKKESISPFQAFCVSTASRVGVGNIAGVALAITAGGPGAVFWMWVIAFIGSATGFVESTLAQIYKVKKDDGKFHGGPAYYMNYALKMPNLAKLFAVLLAVTFGLIYNSLQSNTIADSLHNAFGVDTAYSAVVIAILTALVIFGGIKAIAKIAGILVPIMAVIYIIIALIVVFMNIEKVPAMFALIFHDAFSPSAAVGGGLWYCIMQGMKRGLFSNEAGEGSVPNAAATADASHPAEQGLIQAFGVYVDTWFICTATAFIVLLGGVYEIGAQGIQGISLTQDSLAALFGAYAPKFLSAMVFLFAFSSIIGNYFYGEINVSFFGKYGKNLLLCFRVLVVVMVAFGAIAKLKLVWNLADLFMVFLCATNLFAITLLFKNAKIAFDDYVAQKRSGVKIPKFSAKILPDQTGISEWKD